MNARQLLFFTYCLLMGFMMPSTSYAGLFDDLKKAGSAFTGTLKTDKEKDQKNLSINSPSLNKDSALAERVTDIRIEDFLIRCPPYTKDDTWHIRRTGFQPNGMNNTSDITDTITYADSKTVKLNRAGSNSIMQEDEFRLDKGDYFLENNTMQSPSGEIKVDFTPEIPTCPLPEVGQVFTGIGKLAGKKTAEITITIVSINPLFVEVTVPAGTFNTRKIDLKTVMSSKDMGKQETRETLYFADRIGVVKEIVRFSNTFEVYELLDYKF